MNDFVIIATPVFEREWILPFWFRAIESQNYPISDIGFIFEAVNTDEATIQTLIDFSSAHPELRCFDIVINSDEGHKSHPEGQRSWNRERYHLMAKMRNDLLDRARVRNPDRYFSLDSDIILEDTETISRLVELTNVYDAVAPLCFMTKDSLDFPNVMSWGPEPPMAFRKEYSLGQVFKADVIMAAKMMSPKVFNNVKYSWHRQGEDLGWSFNALQEGLNLWSISNLYVPHIMSRAMLNDYQESGDPRFHMLKEKCNGVYK